MEDNKFTGQSLAQEQQSSGKSTQNAPLKDVRPEVPLSQYRESTGRPYAVEFFQIDNWNELNDFTDINDMRDKVFEFEVQHAG